MPPAQDQESQEGGDLESRLRGLILSNANPLQNRTQDAGRAPPHMAQGPPHMYDIPQLPHMAQGPHMYDLPQQQHMANVQLGLQQTASSIGQPPLSTRKRPNQAQRRQMNSQLSIPINPRPPQGVQAGLGPNVSGSQPHPSWGNTNFTGQPQTHPNQRYQQPQNSSSRFHIPGPGSQYSPRTPFPQASPQSPMHHYQPGQSPQFHSRQNPNQFQQQHQQNPYSRTPPQNRQLYQPGAQYQGRGRPLANNPEELTLQSEYIAKLLQERVADVGIDIQEEAEKEAFRSVVEQLCREAISEHEQQDLGHQQFDPCTVELQCFGSMKSGFATKASDMDLALLTPKSSPAPESPESPIPRILEKKLLSVGYGARLLTRTRVPIIKLCEKPTEKLLSDLLEERMKWENGFTAEPEDDDEELEETESGATTNAEKVSMIDVVNPETPADAGKVVKKRRPASQSTSAAEDTPQKTKEVAHERKVGLLKQKDQQSLGDYYNTAKRYLRKIGGRDITASSPDLDEVESEILNDVCKNFIYGLSSEALSARLRSYQSIAPLFDPSLPRVQRSLQGVWTQIEGERLALAWETRSLSEADDRYEFECLNNVQAWRALQDKQGPLIESLLYNRQLYNAAEKLKKISSLQLVYLEQIQQEEPVYYQARVKKIMDDLTGRDLRSSSSTIAPIIVAHYIAGIYDKEIREALENADRSQANLPTIALHHRALQLAKDYEHALNVGLYDDADRPDVEQYISLLRSCNYYNVPLPPEPKEANLITQIRRLPDPTEISLNKPRDRYKDHLEFPKTDIGIQCDINFSAHLAIHNTQLLRCYSQSDPRVKPMILFVKNWAKVRGINTPYRGTLSSYGYVLMVLHYLVNIAQPFVCSNLQLVNKDPPRYLPPAEIEARTTCKGKDVRFWRNEAEIKSLAERKMLCHNHDSVGILLRGFFEYFAQNGQMTTVQNRGFDWGREVLSLRTPGGILTKQEKNWVGAKTIVETTTVVAPPTPSTVKPPSPEAETERCSTTDTPEVKIPKLPQKTVEETKEIRHRYLFAIEDPFELDHNVARTVTHNGIVSIRDEFRRAWKVIRSVGKPYEGQEGGLLDPVKTVNEKSGFQDLMDLIHGPVPKIKFVAQEVKGMDLKV